MTRLRTYDVSLTLSGGMTVEAESAEDAIEQVLALTNGIQEDGVHVTGGNHLRLDVQEVGPADLYDDGEPDPPVAVPTIGDECILRYVALGDTGYTLLTWDAYQSDRDGRIHIGYALWPPSAPSVDTEIPLFAGQDFSVPHHTPIDSDATLRSLLTFLTRRPGDTDRDYFDSYTPAQMTFAEGDAAHLWEWSTGADDIRGQIGDESIPFTDLIDRGTE